jgi:TatD DNase family protein
MLPTLDAHAHIDPEEDLEECGAVLAQAFCLEEQPREAPNVAWGVGCHPRVGNAQAEFDRDRFATLATRTAIVGEVGLDGGSRVPWDRQLATLRDILAVVADLPRIVSIHSFRATSQVLEELRSKPIIAPVLHWWTGTASETSEAVDLGCYFSIHSQVARRSKWRTRVPPERILIESDHGVHDPPAAIPLRVGWVEYLVAQQYGMTPVDVRRLAWRNFGTLVGATDTAALLPRLLCAAL